MSTQLYRSAAIASRGNGNGQARLVLPPSFVASIALVSSLAVGVLLLIVFGQYTAKDAVRGYVTTTAGNVELYAASSGRIRNLHVREGDNVREGDVLMTLETARASGMTGDARRQITATLKDERQALIEQARRATEAFNLRIEDARGRLRDLQRQSRQLAAREPMLQSRLAIDRRRLQRLQELDARGYPSVAERERAELDVIEQKIRLSDLMLDAERMGADLRQAQRQLDELPVEKATELARLNSELHRLAARLAESETRSLQEIVAPSAGIVSGLLVRPDQTISADTPLLNLLPDDQEFAVELLIPSRTIGSLRNSAEVRIRYDAYPYQKYGIHRGTISRVTRTTVLPGDPRIRVAVTEPVYLARVALEAQQIPSGGRVLGLQVGMTLTADILRDERRIIEWLFDPLLSATNRL